jgi:hypothetical protein
MTDPMTPPTELWQQWEEDWHHSKVRHVELEPYIATQAAQWGADQELEACCEWLEDTDCDDPQDVANHLRAARRPKPPSLKEQALKRLESLEKLAEAMGHDSDDTIRRALEALPDNTSLPS